MQILKYLLPVMRGRVPGQLVIQFTDRCNALCPQCGMRKTEAFARSKLSAGEVRRIIDAAARNGVQAVSFTGGEPLLYLNELVGLMKYAGDAGIPFIRTGTNGFFFADSTSRGFLPRIRKLARQLADTPLRNLWISIDSAVPKVHETMRGFPGVIAGLKKALPIFHDAGIFPSANLGINRNINGFAPVMWQAPPQNGDVHRAERYSRGFRTAFRRFYRFVGDMGFTMVNTCYPMSIDENERREGLNPVYGATAVSDVVRFTSAEKAIIYQALLDVIGEFRSKIRIFSPRSALYALVCQHGRDQKTAYPCRGGIDFFYVDAKDGHAYPCGYRGNESLGRYWRLDRRRTSPMQSCTLCDWECFRDPSELFGPLLQVYSSPLTLLRRVRHDPEFFQYWREDLRYYHACAFFDGRTPPDDEKLRDF